MSLTITGQLRQLGVIKASSGALPPPAFDTLLYTLDNPNAYGDASADYFGNSISVSGNRMIVGAYYGDGASGLYSGNAYVYDLTTNSVLHTLYNPNVYASGSADNFGWSVAISGNYAIVGAYGEDDAGGTSSGAAYIFDVTTGALLHTLTNPGNTGTYGSTLNNEFGWSVAISGNYAIVSAHRTDDAGGADSGKAYIYDVTTGALFRTLDNPNPRGSSLADNFGKSVAISNNYAAVGASGEDTNGTNNGSAYIFDVTTGALLHTLSYTGVGNNNTFGDSIAMSGNYAIVGARYEDDAGGSDSGKAYIFDVTTGALLHTLDNPNAYDTSAYDRFGSIVAINSNYAVVGVPNEDDAGGTSSGKAYVFDVTTGALAFTLDNPNAHGTSAGDNFGSSVAISGGRLFVGASSEGSSTRNSGDGKVYIFGDI